MNIPNPDSWLDALVIICWGIVAVAVPSWFAQRAHKIAAKIDKSVSNGHTKPIREDLDAMGAALTHIRGDLHTIRTDLHDIRVELREERRDRLDLENRVKGHFKH